MLKIQQLSEDLGSTNLLLAVWPSSFKSHELLNMKLHHSMERDLTEDSLCPNHTQPLREGVEGV